MSIKLATVGNAVRQELVGAGFTFVDRLPTLEASVPITTVEQLRDLAGRTTSCSRCWSGSARCSSSSSPSPARGCSATSRWPGSGSPARPCSPSSPRSWRVRVVISGGTDRLADPVAADAARAVVATFGDTLVRNATVVGVLLVIGLAVAAYVAARAGA